MGRSHQVIWRAFAAITEGGGLIDAWAVGKVMRKLGAMDGDLQAMEGLFSDAANGFGSSDLRPRVAKVADSYKRRLLGKSMTALAELAITADLRTVEAEFAEVAGQVAQHAPCPILIVPPPSYSQTS